VNPATFVPRPTYGRDLLAGLPRELFRAPIVHTQPEPWPLVAAHFDAERAQVHQVTTMEHAVVKATAEGFAPASAVFGVGGGMALDHAKYTAWHLGLPLVLVPSILSVDAGYTRAIGVREGGKVRYVGDARPQHLAIDFGLLQAAPPLLNKAGVGDIASIFTALWDWREAGRRLGEAYDARVAAEARAVLDRLFAAGADIRDVTERGLYELSEGYVAEVRLCEQVGNSRPEEGSEHYLAYCLESLTRRPYVHGQLISACIAIAGTVQGQDLRPFLAFVEALDLDCRLKTLRSSAEEMRAALLTVKDYVARETSLLPGVFHFRNALEPDEADEVLAALVDVLGT
jgi:glycerol-1-phosphate dehydrogenase [NAD(P)+]